MAGMGRRDHIVCAVAAVAQITTIRWTWDLWAARSSPPNLPLVDILVSIGWAPVLIVLCVATAIRPRWGGPAFGVALLMACLGDQTRIQPGVISVAVLMIAPAYGDAGRAIARWHLCAMWLWAGLHKLLSPEWEDLGSRLFADAFRHSGWADFIPVALPLFELGLGLTALIPRAWRLTAAGAAVLHIGIVVTLSPHFADWNSSVWPWNAAVAVAAPLLYLGATVGAARPSRTVTAAAIALLAFPALFYVGAVDAYLSHNVYTANTAAAVVCRPTEAFCTDEPYIATWDELNVPLPPEPRLFRQTFNNTCEPGDVLWIRGRHTRFSDPPSQTAHRCVRTGRRQKDAPADGATISLNISVAS